MKRLVLVGGGHAHVEVLRRFGLQREAGVEITLINTSRHTVYSGMLPGLIAGHYGWRACFIDLEVLARFAGARLLRDIAIGLDLERKLVRCADAAEVGYDIASVDVGSVPATPALAPPDRQGLPVRPVQRFVSAFDGFVHQAGDRELNLVVVAADAAGIELCLSMQYRLQQRVPHNRVRFSVIPSSEDILPDHNAAVRERMRRVLQARGVAVRTGSRVMGMDDRGLILGDRPGCPALAWRQRPSHRRLGICNDR